MSQQAAEAAPVLIVEDEVSILEALRYLLEAEGYVVECALDGGEALRRFHDRTPCLVLLDLMLPGISGLDLCRIIRSESNVPIVMVTAKEADADKVVGLELGADDYITKPFSTRELLSRVKALLRRAGMVEAPASTSPVRCGPIELDPANHTVRVRGTEVSVPRKEFALLKVLLEGAERLQTRESLIRRVWGDDYYGDTRTLDVHIKRLRAKIELDRFRPRLLKTVRGLGYKFDPE